jgi:hypothetical protein
MKQILLLAVAAVVAFWLVASHWLEVRGPGAGLSHPDGPLRSNHRGELRWHVRDDERRQTQQVLGEAGRTPKEARQELGRAVDEAADGGRASLKNESVGIANEPRGDARAENSVPRRALVRDAEGLPVPIILGTRVTQAYANPPLATAQLRAPNLVTTNGSRAVRGSESASATPAGLTAPTIMVTGLLCATEERAREEARRKLVSRVREWLEPEVSGSWTPPSEMLDAMVVESRLRPVVKDTYTVYEAMLEFDASPQRRASLVAVFTRELVQHRLINLGGMLVFVLICLGVINIYIRLDEATKGYYTNRLRTLAIAGVSAAALIIYQMLA